MSTTTERGAQDLELLRQAKTGDFAAFQKLIDALQPQVYGLAFRILRQALDAEDVTQQTFLSLIENIEQFREESSVKTWVMRIASNHALKILRRRKTVGIINMSSMSTSDSYGDVPHPEFIAPWSLPPDVLASDHFPLPSRKAVSDAAWIPNSPAGQVAGEMGREIWNGFGQRLNKTASSTTQHVTFLCLLDQLTRV